MHAETEQAIEALRDVLVEGVQGCMRATSSLSAMAGQLSRLQPEGSGEQYSQLAAIELARGDARGRLDDAMRQIYDVEKIILDLGY